MNDPFHSEEEKLARLIREAGNPTVSPDPRYAESLRSTILDHLGPEKTVTTVTKDAGVKNKNSTPVFTTERNRKMKRLAKLAIAASLFMAIGIFTAWTVIGRGSTNLAFAEVAKVLDSLQCVTFDMTSELKQENGQTVTNCGKGFFLAPSRQRIEMKGPAGHNDGKTTMIMISDGQAAKCLMLMPEQKLAMTMNMEKARENMKKSPSVVTPDLFDQVRQFVREENSGTGENVEKLGKKEIDGKTAIGFRTHNHMMDITCWAEPETAQPIRIEITGEMWGNVRVIMDHFRYDVTLAPLLFSIEPPKGYSSQAMNITMPVEKDLFRTLRTIAENNKGMFPAKLGMNKEVMESLMAIFKPEMEKLEAEFGVKPKPGEKPPAKMMAKAMKTIMPLTQKYMKGIQFYMQLTPENDPHYTGKGVKLNTPDRPILWYKPTGAEKYRVIYADLSAKEMTSEEVKGLDVKELPEAKGE